MLDASQRERRKKNLNNENWEKLREASRHKEMQKKKKKKKIEKNIFSKNLKKNTSFFLLGYQEKNIKIFLTTHQKIIMFLRGDEKTRRKKYIQEKSI